MFSTFLPVAVLPLRSCCQRKMLQRKRWRHVCHNRKRWADHSSYSLEWSSAENVCIYYDNNQIIPRTKATMICILILIVGLHDHIICHDTHSLTLTCDHIDNWIWLQWQCIYHSLIIDLHRVWDSVYVCMCGSSCMLTITLTTHAHSLLEIELAGSPKAKQAKIQ